ncbi:transcriptional regulator, LysR family [Geomicrobium sp. JCM 19039]|nr:transcriptional regulator, LysR family [Geomicrobium sp. JCM 19039]
MDIKQLTTFQEAAESLNLTQTAKKLKYSQSNVTAQIKGLEQELGIPLFERLGKRIHLTDSGHTFKRYADQMIATNREAKLALHEDESSGTIIVGAQESQCTYRLMPILKSFKKAIQKSKSFSNPPTPTNEQGSKL